MPATLEQKRSPRHEELKNRLVRDADQGANPRQLLLMGRKELAGTHKMYAAVTGANGMVYLGGTTSVRRVKGLTLPPSR